MSNVPSSWQSASATHAHIARASPTALSYHVPCTLSITLVQRCAITSRYFDAEIERQTPTHYTTLNKTSDERLKYGDTPIKASEM